MHEPIAWMVYAEDGQSSFLTDDPADIKEGQRAYAPILAPFEPATVDEIFDGMNRVPRGVFVGREPTTIWFNAWKAAERHHGIAVDTRADAGV